MVLADSSEKTIEFEFWNRQLSFKFQEQQMRPFEALSSHWGCVRNSFGVMTEEQHNDNHGNE